MKLHNVARYFNDTRCMDAYSGLFLFDGQLDVYTEGVRDGVTIQRRVLEVAPNVTPPTRRAVRFSRTTWLMGKMNPDEFQGEEIRNKYAVQSAEGLAEVYTLADLLTTSPDPLRAYAARVWVKTNKEIEEDSDQFNQMSVYFAQGEPVEVKHVVRLSGRYHFVREVYMSTAGFLAAIVEMMDDPVIDTLQVDSAGFDPVTEAPIPGATYRALRLRWQTDFEYMSLMTPKFERGDAQVVVAQGSVVPVGSQVTLSDGTWFVLNDQDRDGVKYLHCTRSAP